MPPAPAFPDWLLVLSWCSLCLGLGCAALLLADVVRHPQRMGIMNAVWPVTALFGSVLLTYFYFRYGRNASHGDAAHGGHANAHKNSATPFPVMVAKGSLHCGAGCTLGDIIAETLAFVVPSVAIWFGWQTLFAEKMYAVWILDFILAFGIGIVFQYFAIVPMRDLSPREGVVAAVKADALSLACWQIGMYGMMYLAQRTLTAHFGGPAMADGPVFWFAMQIAMIAGFITSYPANWWLISSGVKEKM